MQLQKFASSVNIMNSVNTYVLRDCKREEWLVRASHTCNWFFTACLETLRCGACFVLEGILTC